MHIIRSLKLGLPKFFKFLKGLIIMKQHYLRRIAGIIILNTVLVLLNGCASFTQQKSIKINCATSRMLVTDITQPTQVRSSMLPTGEICPQEAT
jgi:hypothetical protein